MRLNIPAQTTKIPLVVLELIKDWRSANGKSGFKLT
ncbi:bacteriocin immunity protein [Pseudomonas syringae]